MEQSEPVIKPIMPTEAEQLRMMNIRFDCIVRMHDFAVPVVEGSWFTRDRQLPAQWYAMEQRFTMEFIDQASPQEIGEAIKASWQKMKDTLNKIEQRR